jgi:hypothetical protein
MSLLVGLPEVLVDESRVVPDWHHHHHHHGYPRSHITRGIKNRPVGGRSSETYHPIDMINKSINLSIYFYVSQVRAFFGFYD